MNQVLSEIVRTRRSIGRDGTSSIDVHSNISVEEGLLLSRLRSYPTYDLQSDEWLGLEGHGIAFEKTAHDSRQCDHHVEF